MEYIVIVLLLTLIALLISTMPSFFFDKRKKKGGKEKNETAGKGEAPGGNPKQARLCPLCGASLSKGENVKSMVFPAGEKDSIMEVYGCPHCNPPGGRRERLCPVCGKKVPPGGYVIGRYFTKPGKRHLHVLGCTQCRKT